MTNSYLEHPSDEALERFILNRAGEQELEVIEPHILGCERCITGIEVLDCQITELKTALSNAEYERIKRETQPHRSLWRNWFTIPRVSWAGAACASLAGVLTVIPTASRPSNFGPPHEMVLLSQSGSSLCSPNENAMSLVTCRSSEVVTIPRNGGRLNLDLNASDIPNGPVDVEIVHADGGGVWNGHASVNNERTHVSLPQISQPSTYFLRIYAPASGPERELLREFRFDLN